MTTTGLPFTVLSIGIAIGLAVSTAAPRVWAALSGPAEYKGLSVGLLAELSADTMQATIGLESYTMRMRTVWLPTPRHYILPWSLAVKHRYHTQLPSQVEEQRYGSSVSAML